METSFHYEFEGADESETWTVQLEYDQACGMYGCDADGNRGMWQCGVDDIRFRIYDENDREITLKVKETMKDEYKKIEDMAPDYATCQDEGCEI